MHQQQLPTTDPLAHEDPLLSCDEQHLLHEVEVVGQSEGGIGSGCVVRVGVRAGEERWEVARRYEDCEWLFKALKRRFPGALFPYFPSPAAQNALEQRLKSLTLNLPAQLYAPRLQELSGFLRAVCRSKEWGGAEEVTAFLARGEEFQKRKEEMARAVEEAKTSSRTFSIYSFFSRGISWVTREHHEPNGDNDLLRLKAHFNTHAQQLAFLLQKFAEIIALKTAELEWKGTITEVDSVERVRARMASGRVFGERLLGELEGKVMVRLLEALKAERQVQEQLEERTEEGKLLEYLRSARDEQRVEALQARLHEFDRRMLEEWSVFEQGWKQTVGELDSRFRAIWLDYCDSMARIWK